MNDVALTDLAWRLTAHAHLVCPEDAEASDLRRQARSLGFIVGLQMAVGFRSRRNVSEMLRVTGRAVELDWIVRDS